MNDILARSARRATVGIALSAALAAGIAPATAIAAETSSPTGAVALQAEDAATAKEKAYAAMQEALKNLEAAKVAASPEKLAQSMMTLPLFKRSTTWWRRKPPNGGNAFPPCKRTSMQPKPNTMRPTAGQAAFRQN